MGKLQLELEFGQLKGKDVNWSVSIQQINIMIGICGFFHTKSGAGVRGLAWAGVDAMEGSHGWSDAAAAGKPCSEE